MKKIVALIAALVMALSLAVAAPTSAAPADPAPVVKVQTKRALLGSIVVHAADDDGYNPPIQIQCANGSYHSLGLGTNSRVFCNDARYVWAGAGDQVKCKDNGDIWWHNWYGPKWNAFGNISNVTCYQQKA